MDKFFYKFNFDEKDIIKNNTNEYLNIDYNGNVYIRNFCNNKKNIELDNIYDEYDLNIINKNSLENKEILNSSLYLEKYQYFSTAIIYGNNNIPEKYLNNNFLKIGINYSLKEYYKYLNIYCCNNPYSDCLNFLPNFNCDKWPQGFFSYRVSPNFIKLYKGNKSSYNTPVCIHGNYPINFNNYIVLEDHRSIILTIFNLCFKIGIKDIILINTENYIKEYKEGSIYIKKDLYMYPQQILDLSIVSAGSYWLKKFGINVYTINNNFDFMNHIDFLRE